MIVLSLDASGINPALARDNLLVHNMLTAAMSHVGARITKYSHYTREHSGLFEVFADDDYAMLTYRAQRNGDIYVVVTAYDERDPKAALDYIVDNLRPDVHNCRILLKKGIDDDNTSE